jgi:hypothetical protein
LLVLGIVAAVVAGLSLIDAKFAEAVIWLGGAATLLAGAFTSPRIGLYLASNVPDTVSGAVPVEKPPTQPERAGERQDVLKRTS